MLVTFAHCRAGGIPRGQVEPLVEIVLSLALGALAGLILNQLEIYFHSRSKRMSLSVAFVLLTVGGFPCSHLRWAPYTAASPCCWST